MIYVGRYMCNSNFCPCSSSIDPVVYGDRASELESYLFVGEVDQYYQDCYGPMMLYGDQIKGLNVEFLSLLERFEIEENCAGIC